MQILDRYTLITWVMKKTWLLMTESVYWIKRNANIEQTVKQCSTCLEFQHTQLCETAIHYDMPCKVWEVIAADIFMINNENLLFIVDYYSKFPAVKKIASLSADDQVYAAKMIFAEFGLPWKIIWDVGTSLILETFKEFCRKPNIQ